jgi:dTDP-4-amino-4,6-dideoxygalactose transaminase
MDGIMEVASKFGLFVIEDAAQAYRTRYRDRLVGTIGSIGCFSLQQSKHMTAGDGGLTITNLPDLAQRAKLFSDKGWKRPLYKDVEFLAPNYRMTELQAAVALAQLGKLDREVDRRQELAHLLDEIIAEIPGILPQKVSQHVEHSYWQYAIFLDRQVIATSVFEFGEALQAEGIPCLPGYTREPMYMYPVFQNKRFYGASRCPYDCNLYDGELRYYRGLCPNAERALSDVLVLPWNSRLTNQDVEDIGKALHKVARAFAYVH